MLIRNMDHNQGLCNGTSLVVTRLGRYVFNAKILAGKFAGRERMIPRITLDSTEEDFPFIIRRTQFPVRLCFAMTMNKSQGLSATSLPPPALRGEGGDAGLGSSCSLGIRGCFDAADSRT